MNLNKKTIYIGIASYRDPYISETLKSLYNQALYPERIKTHCFIQHKKDEEDCIPNLDKIDFKNRKIAKSQISIELKEAGEIFSIYECRNKSFEFLNSSYDYALQIDAHNQFHPGWDVLLTSLYEDIEDENYLISVKLPFWYIINNENVFFDGPYKDFATYSDWRSPESKKNFLKNQHWNAFPEHKERIENKLYDIGWYLFGGFIFGKPDFFLLKRPDWLFVRGEEFLDSIKAFTGGWNVYTLRYVPIFHLYTGYRDYTGIERRLPFNDFPHECSKKEENTFDRIRSLIFEEKVDNEIILSKRTIQDLYKFLGYSIKEVILNWEKEE